MARYESSCRRLFDNNVDDVITVEVAGLTLESFFTVIVVGGVEGELGRVAPVWVSRYSIGDSPSCESPSAFLNVLFSVVGFTIHADSHGE